MFDGSAGRLDHAIATGTLSPKVGRALHWPINADEPSFIDYNTEFKAPLTTCGGLCPPDLYTATPYRASDHDPVVVGLNVFKTILGTSGNNTLVGTPGDDVFVGGAGVDTMTGNGGINVYVYNTLDDGNDGITDFTPGRDLIDLRAVLASVGYNPNNPSLEGWVRVVQFKKRGLDPGRGRQLAARCLPPPGHAEGGERVVNRSLARPDRALNPARCARAGGAMPARVLPRNGSSAARARRRD